jgi:putative ABC transport system permease protein
LFRKEQVDRELDEELRAYQEMAANEKMKDGMSRKEALRAVRLERGSLEVSKEIVRSGFWEFFLETCWQDLRFSLRMLRKAPLFAALATLTLAVGIGATTAMFSVINAVLLRAAPYQHPAQLVKISARNTQGDEELLTAGDFSDWKAETEAFDELAAYKRMEFHALTGTGDPDEVWAPEVSTNIFHVLGVNPALGRTFAPNETQAIVLSYEYWRSHFSADPEILGRTLALDGKPYTIIGVASADLEFPQANTQMWIPLTFSVADKGDHEHESLDVIGRLKAGVSLEQTQAELSVTAQRLALQFPKTNAGRRALVKPYKDREIGDILRSAIYALLAAVVLVFAIVCANTTGMLLARGSMREAEMAIRCALGAGRLRLVRQLVAESVLLSAAGGVVGLVLAWCGLTLIVSLVPKYNLIETQALHRITLNLPALGFTVAWTFLTGIVAGLLPAVRVSSLNINESLKEHGRASATGIKGPRLRRILVACEVAIALILLVGAGLLIQSSTKLETAPTGFKPDHLLTVRVPLVNYKYAQGERSAAFYRTVLERIEAIPGVTSAAMANNLPFTGFHTSVDLPASPNSTDASASSIYVAERSISPGYFRAMGIPLKSGREFTESDNQRDARCVLIVNEAMAHRYWPGETPVGKLVPNACPKGASALVVGMVADSKQVSVDAPANPEVYSPYAQFPFASFLVNFVVRTSSNPSDFAAAVRSAVWDVDRDQPVIQVRTMGNVIGESIWPYHVSASMLAIFAAIALVLASVGIYGLLAYSVSERTHEIGIRLALGARREDVLRLVIGEGLALAFVGLVAGTIGAIGLTRFLKTLLYGVGPSDPQTYVAVTLILVVVALLACYIPARRAMRVDPIVALRYE